MNWWKEATVTFIQDQKGRINLCLSHGRKQNISQYHNQKLIEIEKEWLSLEEPLHKQIMKNYLR